MRILLFLVFVYGSTSQVYALDVIGHRGARASYPESSLKGYIHAVYRGVDYLEMDLRMTRDAEIIIHHDETINRHICTYSGGGDITGDIFPEKKVLSNFRVLIVEAIFTPPFPVRRQYLAAKFWP